MFYRLPTQLIEIIICSMAFLQTSTPTHVKFQLLYEKHHVLKNFYSVSGSPSHLLNKISMACGRYHIAESFTRIEYNSFPTLPY